jgi:hypothetical protein
MSDGGSAGGFHRCVGKDSMQAHSSGRHSGILASKDVQVRNEISIVSAVEKFC